MPLTFKDYLEERCWPGYKPTPGKTAYSKGSCVKEEEGLAEGEFDNMSEQELERLIDDLRERAQSLQKKAKISKTAKAEYDELVKRHHLAAEKLYGLDKQGVSEDWQKVNRQDKTDGLSPAAVKAYRRENPGSKLQTAVTEKNPKGKRAKRRLSFCRRMKGMKSRLTSAKNSRDPDSPINKALRRWNC